MALTSTKYVAIKIEEEDREWRNLPGDILHHIVRLSNDDKHPVNKFDTCRVRAVCTSWRACVSPFTPLRYPLQLPCFPNSPNNSSGSSLSQSIFYLIQKPKRRKGNSWLIKVREDYALDKWYLEDPFSEKPPSINHPRMFVGSLDLSKARIKEVARSYLLQCTIEGKSIYASKVVLIRISQHKPDDFTVLALFGKGILGLWRPGEADWTTLEFQGASDIISFEGKFYVSGSVGKLLMIDPLTYSLNYVIKLNLANIGSFSTSLIECNGSLYLLSVIKDTYSGAPHITGAFMLEFNNIDNNWKWKSVETVGNYLFYICHFVTFSIPAQVFGLSNSVLFTCRNGHTVLFQECLRTYESNFRVNTSADGYSRRYFLKIFAKSQYGYGADKVSKMCWPPPNWIQSIHRKESPTICWCNVCIEYFTECFMLGSSVLMICGLFILTFFGPLY